jgi:hypothetical protein
MEFGDLFSFDKKITPTIIKPVYWIGLMLITLLVVIYFFAGFGKLFTVGFFTGVWDMIAAVVFVVFGVLALRIGAELCLAIFDMQEKASPTPPAQI